jgi:2'-5' RNA ligase
MTNLNEIQEELNKHRQLNKDLKSDNRKLRKDLKDKDQEITDLNKYNMHITKKLLIATDPEEKNMYLTTKLNELNKISIDAKLNEVHNAKASRQD